MRENRVRKNTQVHLINNRNGVTNYQALFYDNNSKFT